MKTCIACGTDKQETAFNRRVDTEKLRNECAILCANCHRLEHKALREGRSLLDENNSTRCRDRRIETLSDLGGGDKGNRNRGSEGMDRQVWFTGVYFW